MASGSQMCVRMSKNDDVNHNQSTSILMKCPTHRLIGVEAAVLW
jgi:hypothetical protein